MKKKLPNKERSTIKERLNFFDVVVTAVRKSIENGSSISNIKVIIQAR